MRASLVAAVLVAAFAAAAPAQATSNTVIGFDDLTAGTVVTNQYKPQDLALGSASDFGRATPGSGDCGGPTVATGAVPAFSPANYARLATCSAPGLPASSYFSGTYGEFLSYPRGSLSFEVRELQAGIPAQGISVTGYDDAGNVVAHGSGSAVGTSWTKIVASQNSGGSVPAKISFFSIATTTGVPDPASAPQIAIDDLSFDHAGAPLTATGNAINAEAGSPFSGPVATLTDGDSTATAGDFSATVDWGDGSSSPGSVSGSGGQFTISGGHTWPAAGSYPVHVAVTKVNGRTAAAGTTATVSSGGGGAGPSSSVSVTTPNPAGATLLELSGAGSQPGSGRIISYDWDFNNDGRTDTSTGSNPISHFIFAPGVHTVALTVTNSNGIQSKSSTTFTLSPPAPPPQPDGGQGPCQQTYDNGNVHIVAECIQTLSGGGYVIQTRQLDLNGSVLAPKAGGYGIFQIHDFTEFGIGSGKRLSGPPANFELLNTPIGDLILGGVDLTASPINLAFQPFVPPKVKLADTSSKTLLASFGVGHSCKSGDKSPSCCPPSGETTACATLPGDFPLTGTVNVYLNNKAQMLFDVQVGLDLKAVNFQATGALEVVTDLTSGINLASLQFTIPEAGLASIFEVKDASFVYYFPSDPDASKRDTWQAKATFVFGPLSQPSLAAELAFQKGNFHSASMVFTAPSGTGVPIYPGILLNQIGGSVGANPLQFGGQLGASIATQLELSLAFAYSEPTDTQLGFFGGQGQLSFQGDKIATLSADVYSDGYTDAAVDLDLHFPFASKDPVVSVTGHIGFWDEPTSGRWEADGSIGLKLWVINAEVAGLINDQYVAGCADINGFGVQGRYKFADSSIDGGVFGFSNCKDQLKPYKETPVTQHSGGFGSSARAAAADGGGTITLPGGQMGEELRIASASGQPVVTITGPGGERFTTPTQPGNVVSVAGKFMSAVAPDGRHVIVLLRRPQGGKWSIAPTAGAPAITKVETAADVPPAKISAHVRSLRGARFALAYKVANYVPGTVVQFVERGRDSTHVLGSARSARGSIAFKPEDAVGRGRNIVAYLRTAAGAPLRTVVVGHYRAPAASRPGRVGSPRITRRGTSALLSWRGARGARTYLIRVRGSDGSRRSVFASAKQHSVVLADVLPQVGLVATVVPEGGPNLLSGRAATVRLRPESATAEVLRCARGTCGGKVVPGTLLVTAKEIHATLMRGRAVVARGIASGLRGPTQITLASGHPLRAGRYQLVLTYRSRTVRNALTIR